MHVKSKVVELDTVVYTINLRDLREDIMSALKIKKQLYKKTAISNNLCCTKGLCLIETLMDPRQKLTNRLTTTKDNIQVLCMMDGCSAGRNSLRKKCQFNLGIMHLAYCKGLGHSVEIISEKKTRYVSIIMSRQYYLNLVENEPWITDCRFYRSVMEEKTVGHGEITFPLDIQLKRTLNDLTKQEFPKKHSKHLTDLKLKELFLHVLIGFSKAIKTKTTLTQEEHKKLEAAKTYLTQHFDRPPTSKQLARIVFLNELKLKQGFKQLYHTTLYAYVRQLKMEKAETLLSENNTVTEMAEKLGYNSVSHFISIFKKFHGYTPKQGLMEKAGKKTGTKN